MPPHCEDIKAAMKRRRVSVTRLADLLGINRPHLSNVLSGKAALTVNLAVKIDYALDQSADYQNARDWLSLQVHHDVDRDPWVRADMTD